MTKSIYPITPIPTSYNKEKCDIFIKDRCNDIVKSVAPRVIKCTELAGEVTSDMVGVLLPGIAVSLIKECSENNIKSEEETWDYIRDNYIKKLLWVYQDSFIKAMNSLAPKSEVKS